MLPTLPDARNAKLPATYISAKQALEKCERIDECKDWKIKADALMSYARQAKDDSLLDHAREIQARAWRRAGELLALTEPKRGAGSGGPGGGRAVRIIDQPNRKSVAETAGLSVNERKAALRVANIPKEKFEKMVAGKASMKQLVAEGRLQEQKPPDPSVRAYVDADMWLSDFKEIDTALAAKGARDDKKDLLRKVNAALKWLTKLQRELSK